MDKPKLIEFTVYEEAGFGVVDQEARPLCPICDDPMTKKGDGQTLFWSCPAHPDIVAPVKR